MFGKLHRGHLCLRIGAIRNAIAFFSAMVALQAITRVMGEPGSFPLLLGWRQPGSEAMVPEALFNDAVRETAAARVAKLLPQMRA